MDLLIMSALSQHVALMPVITGVGLTADQGAACQQLVSTLLKDPGLYVEGLKPFKVFTYAQCWLHAESHMHHVDIHACCTMPATNLGAR